MSYEDSHMFYFNFPSLIVIEIVVPCIDPWLEKTTIRRTAVWETDISRHNGRETPWNPSKITPLWEKVHHLEILQRSDGITAREAPWGLNEGPLKSPVNSSSCSILYRGIYEKPLDGNWSISMKLDPLEVHASKSYMKCTPPFFSNCTCTPVRLV